MPTDFRAIRTNTLIALAQLAGLEGPGGGHNLHDTIEDLNSIGVFEADNDSRMARALRNQQEAESLRNLGRAIDDVTRAVGQPLYEDPKAFLEHPLWQKVEKLARVALAKMTDNTMKHWLYFDTLGVERTDHN
jgi:hypothetical protein